MSTSVDLEAIRKLMAGSKPAVQAPTKAVSPVPSASSTPSSAAADAKSSRTFYLMLGALSFVALLLLYQRYQEQMAMDESNAERHMKANPLTAEQIDEIQRAAREASKQSAAPAPAKSNTPTVEEIVQSETESESEPEPPPVRKAPRASRKSGKPRQSSRLKKRKKQESPEEPEPEPVPEQPDPNFQPIEDSEVSQSE